ncbi:energy transducer TonB [Lysobacter sp. BMK333-48F3]|uniref:energy transducer TonB n=1 Tax=Lysobacter sp. BMK333-48F3 TaxID=2867962 RepID=UPI001C8C0308|nr:energy transducer TonB [Lysobacter sp. BMK333-48F3]MBX9403846.1 energy transducer TonB [Lysobacter sp. BMK333-48F3]
MVRAIPSSHPRQPLDGVRIAGNTGAIAFNTVMLLLLLAPLSAPKLILPKADDGPIIQFIRPPVLIEPPPPKPEEPLTIRREPAPPVSQPIRTEPTPSIVVDNPEPGPTDFVGIEQPHIQVAKADPPAGSNPGIQTGASLQALNNPAPPYPPQAVRENLTGVVELEILVGIDGKPIEVSVVRSSGHRLLDQAARRAVLSRWTFQPAMRDGQPVQARGRVPIEFKLAQ